MKKTLELKFWQKLFYVLGWIYGIFNLLFWGIMYASYLINDTGESFFNPKFHKRVYLFGLIMTILGTITFFVIMIPILLE